MVYPVPSGIVAAMNKVMNFETPKAVITVSRGDLISMLGVVQNKVLDWAIEMEKQGVFGDGISFERNEKQKAQVAMNTFNIGDIQNFTGNLGSQENARITVFNNEVLNEIKNTECAIREALPLMKLDSEDAANARIALDGVRAGIDDHRPDRDKIRNLFSDLHDILIGAAGNLTAQGALASIAGILKILG
ncbi:MAG: hypothetical protein JJ891_12700 [Rhizobiaceae bacterium]|nr:hypothetical protein [Rhizobiaceae bacterium]